ncbi:MAG TPA: gliding motility-associated C-terminal domain-containing protein [Puia sp.]|nr:gliding motility-associated C-terminal domain-containing protein [Puia sp.]
MKNSLIILIGLLFISPKIFCQTQSCPVNINFALDNLTHWGAYTGNNADGNDNQLRLYYDTSRTAPGGTINVSTIKEFNLPSVTGIQVITAQGNDLFGGFQKIPTINGYSYNYSILLGSTSITHSRDGANAGGYVRGVSYEIAVPATPAGQPYTMTYAYAMVLENGRHASNDQPLFSATLTLAKGSIISCASPKYFLPTTGAVNNGNALLDSATAKAEGFSVSPQLSPNANPNGPQGTTEHLQDVWTKGWNEVTFDLSPYREQTVTLTFETDNCVPGGHFAYSYVALRNTCAGLNISGPLVACSNTNFIYSVPALAGATYNWTVPAGWTINSGSSTNIIQVSSGTTGGAVIADEVNSCANLKDTIQVATTPPTLPGNVANDAEVCAISNANTLTLSGNRGNILNWISSTDGTNWTTIPNTTSSYAYKNLNATTIFEAVVQNGTTCSIDSSVAATITVDQQTLGGILDPPNPNFCADQTVADILTLNNFNGQITNWQSSTDSINWQNFVPVNNDSTYYALGLSSSTYYRSIVKNGVCPADTSSVASVKLFTTPFPQSVFDPADTTICYGTVAPLNSVITIGTDYTWIKTDSLQNPGNGVITSSPFSLTSQAYPLGTTNYVLSIENNGCPNFLLDTFHINVIPQIIVNPGNDTSVVVGEPLQLQASSNDTTEDIFTWTPPTDLSSPNISSPVGIYGSNIDTITYIVKATDVYGCYGEGKISVRVFKTLPDIFVPNAFTPGKGINNIFRPIAIGISSLKYFRVYNRWGQLVYETERTEQGWDGTVGGRPQDSGTFVWMVQGIDYTGRTITRKGTMVLIR